MCVFAQGMLALTLFLFNWVWIPPANASGPECDFFDFDAMNPRASFLRDMPNLQDHAEALRSELASKLGCRKQ